MPDSAKRVLGVEACKDASGEWVFLQLADGDEVVVGRPLDADEVLAFRDAIYVGMKWAGDDEEPTRRAKEEELTATTGPTEGAYDAALVEEGIAKGLELAAEGYWLDPTAENPVVDRPASH